jgi:hypothetical protein
VDDEDESFCDCSTFKVCDVDACAVEAMDVPLASLPPRYRFIMLLDTSLSRSLSARSRNTKTKSNLDTKFH